MLNKAGEPAGSPFRDPAQVTAIAGSRLHEGGVDEGLEGLLINLCSLRGV